VTCTMINSTDDRRWLRDTHLPTDAPAFGAAVIEGNEDAPTRVTLYARTEPLVTCRPVAVYKATFNGDLIPCEPAPTDNRATGYLTHYPKGSDRLAITDGYGGLLGYARITARWPAGRSCHVTDEWLQVEAVIDGLTYTGRTGGLNLSWSGRETAASARARTT